MQVNYKGFNIEFSEEKNILLRETRGIDFEDILSAIESNQILADLKHKNKKFIHQRILVIQKEGYVYAVPYVIDVKRKVVFLKTIYPSRVLKEKYIKVKGGGRK